MTINDDEDDNYHHDDNDDDDDNDHDIHPPPLPIFLTATSSPHVMRATLPPGQAFSVSSTLTRSCVRKCEEVFSNRVDSRLVTRDNFFEGGNLSTCQKSQEKSFLIVMLIVGNKKN